MTEPKTPEERLKEAREEAVACTLYLCSHQQDEECVKVIDRLAALAVLVGRIQQHRQDNNGCVPGCTILERLLAEMEKP